MTMVETIHIIRIVDIGYPHLASSSIVRRPVSSGNGFKTLFIRSRSTMIHLLTDDSSGTIQPTDRHNQLVGRQHATVQPQIPTGMRQVLLVTVFLGGRGCLRRKPSCMHKSMGSNKERPCIKASPASSRKPPTVQTASSPAS